MHITPMRWTRALALAALALVAAAPPARAQGGAASERKPVESVLQGAYDEGQAGRGESLYRRSCASCHAMNAHAGPVFQSSWAGRTAYDLFELLRTTMPMDDPGRLTREEYAEIVAYMFRLNGYPAGRMPLPSDAEPLRQIRIEAKAGSAGSPAAGAAPGR